MAISPGASVLRAIEGKMRIRAFLHAIYRAGLNRHPFKSIRSSPVLAKTPVRASALALGLLLLPASEVRLFAQQYPQQYSQPYAYNGQPSTYAPPPASYAPQQQYAPPAPDDSQPEPGYGQAQPGYGQVQPLSAGQLDQLVAPIALYPDALIAQILAASTYPAQIVQADRWRQSLGNAPLDQIAASADAQPWDQSVKALTAFPDVLAELDQNLQWTTDLGNAYYNQPQDVFAAIQAMRQRAQAAGTLQSTPQEAVGYQQGNIVLAAANPQVVYVPVYNPWTVYGQPVSPYPGFSLFAALGSFFGSSPVQFGLGLVMNAFSHTGWGWLGWGLNWLTQSLLFNQSNYSTHSTTVADWGLPHGGPRAFPQWGAGARQQTASYRAPNNYGRPTSGFNNGFNTRPTQGFPRTPGQSYVAGRSTYAATRPAVYNRGYQTSGLRYGQTTQALNRMPVMTSRPQPYSRSNYSAAFNSNYRSGYNDVRADMRAQNFSRTASTYRAPMQSYRAPAANFPSNFASRSSSAFSGKMSKSFSDSYAKPSHSGGFHLFGGGSHEPKSFGGEHFSSKHSGGGGHSFGGHSGGGGHGGHHH